MTKNSRLIIEIPSQLQELLSRNNSYNMAVRESIAEFTPWIASKNVYFFPEYTDHGIGHIEAVFRTAEALVTDNSWKVFTPGDAATLLLSILLHDSAMHLTPDSFAYLISEQNTQYCIAGLDDRPWSLVWHDFLTEALRFDHRKLIALFGNAEPVRVPELDPDKMTGRDIKLIGEFLRRYHHRLAHEIAIFGVPGPENKRIKLISVNEDIADLAGLVARSHGMSVRPCIDYLQSMYDDKCEHKGVHAVFLMTLVRVADYLQIQPERAPSQILKVTRLRSPISKGHWNIHHAISDIRNTHADPEALYVRALPSKVSTFLQLRQLFLDIQCELDASWAVLGEVYGRMTANNLHLLGIKLRRIRSNIEDLTNFAKQVTYIPIRATFSTADPHLLNLLVGPLYNGDPAFGIRELIQNAVDSVRELKEYVKTRQQSRTLKLREQEADVVVSIKTDSVTNEVWLAVSDRGIGMTPKVICDYFLCAGASFRESDTWRKEFSNEKGRAKILRTGMFGIGVLAAFLIGNQIHVVTRHVDATQGFGVEFQAGLDTDTIELKRTSCQVGTIICIRVFEHLAREYDQTKWQAAADWYYLSDPSIKIEIEGKQVQPKYNLPSAGMKQIPPNWRRTIHSDYQEIHWTYSNAPSLASNGIRIIESTRSRAFAISPQDDIVGSIVAPNVHVFDPDAKLPLNLQRTDLKQDLPFIQELGRDILKDFLSFILVYMPTDSLAEPSTWGFYQYLKYPGLDAPVRNLAPWICTDQGVSILDRWHISQIGPRSATVFFLNPLNGLLRHCLPTAYAPLIGLQWPPVDRYFSPPSSPVSVMCSHLLRKSDPQLHRLPSTTGVRIFLHTTFISRLASAVGSYLSSRKRATKTSQALEVLQKFIEAYGEQLHNNPKIESETSEWCLFSLGNCPKLSHGLQQLVQSPPPKCKNPEDSIVAEWYFKPIRASVTKSPISELWSEIIGDPIIPYAPSERLRKLAPAFETLASYIRAHKETLKHEKQ